MSARKLFLISRNVVRENFLRKTISAGGPVNIVGVFRTAEAAGDLKALLQAARPEVIYLDGHIDPDQAIAHGLEAKAVVPRLAVILGTKEKDFDLLQRAVEAGLEAVMPEPVEGEQVLAKAADLVAAKLAALEATPAAGEDGALGARLQEASASRPGPPPEIEPVAQPGKGPMMLAFLSSKEGEGKSTVALNLGISLAKNYGKKVLYVDLGETLSETAMLLNRKAPGTFLNILAVEDGKFTPYGVERFSIDYFEDQSFSAICGNPSIEPPTVDREALDLLLRFLRARADFVLLDCPTRFGTILKTALKLADWHVVVVQNTLSSLRNTRVFLGELKRLEYPRHQVKIVINRVSQSAGLAKEDIAKNIDPYPIVASIVSNGPVAIEAVTVGLPLVLHAPESNLAQSIDIFAKRLCGIETTDLDENQKFSLGSMISNFFGGN